MSSIPHNPEALLADLAWMRRLAVSLVNDPTTAEDLVQETWLAALARRWPTGRPTRAWLSKVIRNHAVDHLRSDGRRRDREKQSARPEAVSGQEDLVAKLEAQHLLAATVLELEEPTRTILLMRFQEELQPTQIAERLNLPAGTVRSRISRALHLLRGKLEQHMGGDYRAALLPILAVPLGEVATGVTSATLLGSLTMKKILIASAAAVSVFTVWHYAPWEDPGDVEASAAVETAGNDAGEAGAGRERRADDNDANQENRVRVGHVFGTSGGWWLEGSVHAANGFGDTPARVVVRDARGRNPKVVLGHVTADGRAELELAEIFRHPTLLARGLRVQIEHPDYLPARVSLKTNRRLRQDGFLGRRAKIPFQVTLEPATARVAGKIAVPDGHATAGVRVALFRSADLAVGDLEPVDHAVTSADGSFRLRARSHEKYRVVAWSTGERPLLPKTVRISTEKPFEPIRLELTPGESLRGHAKISGPPPGVRYRLQASAVTNILMTEEVGFELDDVTGQIEETEEVATPRTPSTSSGPAAPSFGPGTPPAGPVSPDMGMVTHRIAPFTDFGGLGWNGKAFEYGQAFAWIGTDGQFEITGLAPGSSYIIEEIQAWFEGVRVPIQFIGDEEEGMALEEVGVPAHDIEVDYKGYLLFAHFSLDGQSFDSYSVAIEAPDETRTSPYAVDTERGRVAISVGGKSDGQLRNVLVPGCEGIRTRFHADRWTEIVLRRRSDLANLTVHLSGDPGRRVEGFSFAILKLVEGRGDAIDLLHQPVHKRLGNRVTLRDIPAGKYEIRMRPYLDRSRTDFGAFTRGQTRQVELAPGNQNFLEFPLEPAGYLELRRPMEFLSAEERKSKIRHLAYRLLDGRGEQVESVTARARPGQDVTSTIRVLVGRIHKGYCNRFFPLLAPGTYTIETWALERPEEKRRTSFRIRSGKVTTLDPPATATTTTTTTTATAPDARKK